ncbi:uncharacterized protein LOC135940679 [Cloeon dipterum]|uniref:uncharacterized protein LOC135940679 n=1 Tax=Cloeon dipterum TaxID=197152 RepID=UPI00321F859C
MMPFSDQRSLRRETTQHSNNVPFPNLNMDLEMHRLLTFPFQLFRGLKFDLLRMLAKEEFYYDHECGFVRSIFYAMTISAVELAQILSHNIEDAEKIISGRLLQLNCDISRNVPIGNVDGVLNYKFESHRLYSLLKNVDHFPHVNIYELAKSGFYYLGEKDNVKCDFCGLEIHGWEQQDKPDDEHLRWNDKCPFMRNDKNVTANNIPIGSEQIDSVKSDAIGSMANVTTTPIGHRPDIVPADGAAGGHFPHQVQEFQPGGDPVEAAQPEPDGPQQNPEGN